MQKSTAGDRVVLTGMAYAIGHYARWIRRGALRIGSTPDDRLVQVTAFRDDRLGRLVLVLINNNASSRTAAIDVRGLTLSGVLEGEQSTETGGYWSTLTLPAASLGGFSIALPPLGVVSCSAAIAGAPPMKARAWSGN